jgi:gamma-glutamyl-gamma-aminobutyrate hydrolase PuuD
LAGWLAGWDKSEERCRGLQLIHLTLVGGSYISHNKSKSAIQRARMNQHSHQHTIHCKPVMTQPWMNLNSLVIGFHLGNLSYRIRTYR